MAPPVQSAYEVLLEAPLHAVHQEVHDSLGHGVLQVLAHNVKVGLHQQPGDLHLDLFLLTHPSWHPKYLLATKHTLSNQAMSVPLADLGEYVQGPYWSRQMTLFLV